MAGPIVDIGKLADPATKLVEVIAQGIGGLYRPLGTVVQAHADAKASMILAKADLEKQELLQRAAARICHVELQRQQNIEVVIEKAKAALPDKVSPEPVSKDWINQFFNACQDVSDAELQELWGKVLANEVQSPGTISKRALEFLKTLEKAEAKMFETLLAVSFQDDNGWYFIVESDAVYAELHKLEPRFAVLRHLTDVGLIASEWLGMDASKTSDFKFTFGGQKYTFVGPPPPTPHPGFPLLELRLGFRIFTAIGQTFSNIAKKSPAEGLIAALSAHLEKEINVGIRLDTRANTSS